VRKLRTIPSFVQIGTTGASHGSEGELKVYFEDAYLEAVSNTEFLFLDVQGDKVPFRVEWFRQGRDLLVKFSGIGDATESASLISSGIYLPSDEVEAEESIEGIIGDYSKLEGYIIREKERGRIGPVISVEHFPEQEMALVLFDEREVLIPLNDTFITHIDHQSKVITMELPEGILTL